MKAFATWRSELVRVFFDGTIAASTQAEVYSQLTENAHGKNKHFLLSVWLLLAVHSSIWCCFQSPEFSSG